MIVFDTLKTGLPVSLQIQRCCLCQLQYRLPFYFQNYAFAEGKCRSGSDETNAEETVHLLQTGLAFLGEWRY